MIWGYPYFWKHPNVETTFKLEGQWHDSVWSVVFWIWKTGAYAWVEKLVDWSRKGNNQKTIKNKDHHNLIFSCRAKVRVTSGLGSWFKDLHLFHLIFKECFSPINFSMTWGSQIHDKSYSPPREVSEISHVSSPEGSLLQSLSDPHPTEHRPSEGT